MLKEDKRYLRAYTIVSEHSRPHIFLVPYCLLQVEQRIELLMPA
jgi:hypothetical protein